MTEFVNEEKNRPITGKALEQTLSVNLNPRPTGVPAVCSVGALACYEKNGKNWSKTEFPANKYKISISKLLGDKRSKIGESGSIEALKYDNFWFLIYHNNGGDVRFNNFSINSVLISNSSILLEAEKKTVMLTSRSSETLENEVLQVGLPENDEFGIENERGEFKFSKYKTLTIGSNKICDIMVEGVQPFVAIIYVYKQELYIKNLGEEIVINEEGMAENGVVALQHDDKISIAETSFNIKLPETLDSEPVPDGTLCLLDISSDKFNMIKIALPVNKALTFGRGTISDIVISDKSVSRKHAQIITYEDHVLVLDCYSKNGTFVNDSKVGKSRARLGDLITFADKSYLLCYYNG